MYRNQNRVFPMILIVIVMVAVVAGLVTVGRALFGGNSARQQEQQALVATAREQLLTLSADRSVRMTIRGPIVANEQFRTHRITIAPNSRLYTVYSGYLEEIDDQKSFDNNMEAYEEFVNALDKADFTKPGKRTEEEASDVRGICATGHLYEFEIVNATGAVDRKWTSTCSGSPGTFGASVQQVTNLFRAQIPEQTGGGGSSSLRLRF